MREDHKITTEDELRSLYGQPSERARHKQIDHIDPYARLLISKSPFLVLATRSGAGMDCSPKGDEPGFVQVLDKNTVALPDRPGNNRIDGLRNILADPAVGLIFFIPGMAETLRVNGRATISVDPGLLRRFAKDGRLPATVIAIQVDEVFLHCGRALKSAALWDPSRHVPHAEMPGLNEIVAAHVALSKAAGS
ncbi:MSMEG_1061 family FMN-dependent PPOX-type flavoprotein [Rhodoligotrophos defluvii]|uniref:MSMEG_1061 family FMN-dependent PPOX-type flavoprotein n=1 Tax=Rhodoligotrophos defluvii TaxID=2561934 RepID=UPI0010C94B21|nr:MSMEG_1061 family FMN-dependent PPOX-type flavoprotein [Rhodoligotrophos defluvii]